jgi:hypothetical protein
MIFKVLRLSIPFIWFGAVCTISFMEAPLKFFAPNVTLELGLGIGRLVFHALNKLEIVLALLFLLSLVTTRPTPRSSFVMPALVFLILFLQTAWLLPALDARAESLLSGNPPPHSNLHIIYIVTDAVKIVLLLAVGILGLVPLLKQVRE